MGKKSAKQRTAEKAVVTADVKPEAKSVAATQAKTLEEKIALIQALQANIERRIRHINRPAAMAVTAVTVPAVVSTLFLSERWSPFYRFYEQSYATAVEHYDDEIRRLMDEKVIAPYVMPMQKVIEEFIEEKKAALFLICDNKGFAKDTCIDDALTFLDTDLGFKREANLFKTKLLEHFNIRLTSFKQGDKTIKITELLNANIDKHTAKKLFHTVEEAGKKFISAAKDHFYKQVSSESKKVSRNVLNTYVVQYKVAVSMLVQYLIIEPLVARRFPHGIFQNPIPQIEALPVDIEEADSFVALLEAHDAELARIERRNAKIARYGSAVVLGGSFFDLSRMVGWLSLNGLLPTELVIIFCIGLMATGSTDLLKDLYRLYESLVFEGFSLWGRFEFQGYFKQQQATLGNILGTNSYELTATNKGSLEASRFVVRFTMVADGMSSDKLARIFKNILVGHGVKAKLVGGNSVIIPADFSLDGEQVRQLFVQGIKREQDIVTLKKQVRVLLEACFKDGSSFLPMQSVTRAGLPIITMEFDLPLTGEVARTYQQKLMGLFAANEIDIEERNGQLNIVITGAACVDVEELQKLCEQLQAAIQKAASDQKAAEPAAPSAAAASDDSEADKDDDKTEGLRRRKEHAQTTAATAAETTDRNPRTAIPAPLPEPHRVIRWGNVVYDSASNDCKVHPLNKGQFHDARSLARSRYFIMNSLVQKTPGRKDSKKHALRDAVYKAVDAQVQVPVLVPPKAKEGFSIWRSPQVDQNGNSFISSMRVKILGVSGKGDARGFTRLVAVDREGNELHEVAAISLNTHRK